MNNNKPSRLLLIIPAIVCCLISGILTNNIAAEEGTIYLTGDLYCTGPSENQKGSYNYNDDNTSFSKGSAKDYAGKLTISGSSLNKDADKIIVSPTDEREEYILSYSLSTYGINELGSGWFISNEDEKTVGEINLGDKIKDGAFIVEMSRDGENWIVLKSETDVFGKKAKQDQLTYKIAPIQMQNGSYFRITVAYQLKSLVKTEKGFLGIETKIYNYKKNVEIYEFYIKDDVTTSNNNPNNSPRREYRDIIAIKADKGFTKTEEIAFEKKNPQYNENERIGYFVLNGYSGSPDKNANGDYVFTKNAGDDITLWFCLNEKIGTIFDIKGDGKVSVVDDKKTYDKDLQTEETDFHYGALFVKFTNTEGTSRLVEYYDFLRSAASPAADTRVRLYEEGDYEVTLDYEIKSGMSKYNYKMNFSFEVKNGNCMVFFRDKKTTSELANMALAKNGFTVDFANSKNLDVTFQRSTILEGANGILAEDVKENKGVNDLDSFEKEGIYKFTIKNKSTGQVVYKTLFIGSNKYIKALSKNVMDLETLNSYIVNGAKISSDGDIVLPEVVNGDSQKDDN